MRITNTGHPFIKLAAVAAVAAVAALAAASSLAAVPAWALDLTVTVTGVRITNGKVLAALYSQGNWLKGTGVAAAEVLIEAASGDQPARAVLVFRNVPAGRYGIAAFHDENGNGKMDSNGMGMPTEAFGFSQGAKAVFGPPRFEVAAFELSADLAMGITLR